MYSVFVVAGIMLVEVHTTLRLWKEEARWNVAFSKFGSGSRQCATTCQRSGRGGGGVFSIHVLVTSSPPSADLVSERATGVWVCCCRHNCRRARLPIRDWSAFLSVFVHILGLNTSLHFSPFGRIGDFFSCRDTHVNGSNAGTWWGCPSTSSVFFAEVIPSASRWWGCSSQSERQRTFTGAHRLAVRLRVKARCCFSFAKSLGTLYQSGRWWY